MAHTGKILIIIGLILVVAGVIVYFFGNKLGWIGHLPGDINIENDKMRFYFPITTMILLSAIVSFIMWLIRKFF